MKVDVLLGLQWGDEGKGKIVDVLTPKYNVIARFQGGPNAGHTLEFGNIKHVLHTIPSGVFHNETENIIGNGVVIDPESFSKEVGELMDKDVDVRTNLLISKKAHLICPTHRLIDAASEIAKGKEKIGSTLRGIGPTYMDKTGRNGLRIGDIDENNFKEKYNQLVEKHKRILDQFNFDYSNLSEMETNWFAGIELLKEFKHIDSEQHLNNNLINKKTVLAEGAQGSLLDIDFGSYPFVTSSSTVSAGACTGLGIAPNKIGEVFGIFKAYCTRVGSGPFPTELFDADGELMRKEGNEFGATTGRPRRCGWIDLPALKYAVMINGVTQLIMMKADVLSCFNEIKICTHYNYKGKQIDYLPYNISEKNVTPVYKNIKGWKKDLTTASNIDDIPEELNDYINYLENQLNVPITIVSVGPNRSQTLIREKTFV